MAALHGIGVLVTRPEQQALPLCQMLEALGATAVRLPAIEIRPYDDRLQGLPTSIAYDLVIFTSANAVRFGAAVLGLQRGARLAAIGPATLRALQDAGHATAILPTSGFDSEGLLAHPALEEIRGLRILLVKGLEGRELLQAALEERGASVTALPVYARVRATPPPALLAEVTARCAAGQIHAVTATSLEIATRLLELATPALHAAFGQLHWVVPGTRIGDGLRALGLAAPQIMAASAQDQALVDALLRWRATASGA